jgi:hypothetical protein
VILRFRFIWCREITLLGHFNPLSREAEERVKQRSAFQVSRPGGITVKAWRFTHPGDASLADPLFAFSGKRVKVVVILQPSFPRSGREGETAQRISGE